MKKIINQLLKFGVVGGIAFLIDYGILFLCTDILNIHYLISSTISFTISVIFNYVASVVWVFEINEEKSKLNNFILFIVFSVIGLVINQIIMWLGVDNMNIHYLIVKIIATFIVMIFNFITRKIFLE